MVVVVDLWLRCVTVAVLCALVPRLPARCRAPAHRCREGPQDEVQLPCRSARSLATLSLSLRCSRLLHSAVGQTGYRSYLLSSASSTALAPSHGCWAFWSIGGGSPVFLHPCARGHRATQGDSPGPDTARGPYSPIPATLVRARPFSFCVRADPGRCVSVTPGSSIPWVGHGYEEAPHVSMEGLLHSRGVC